MQITVDAATLRQALAGHVAGRSTMPILAHVLIVAEGDCVTLTTTDMAKWISASVNADIASPGRLTADCAQLVAALRGLHEPVTLSAENDVLQVLSAGRRRFRVDSLAAQEFPDCEHGEATPLSVDPLAMKAAITSTEYAAGRNDVRPFVNGVMFTGSDVVCCNGHRLAVAGIEIGGIDTPISVPSHSIKYVATALTAGASVSLLSNQRRPFAIDVAADGHRLTCVLQEDVFPPSWRQLVPSVSDETPTLEMDKKTLAALLARLKPFAFRKIGKGDIYHGHLSFADGLAVSAPDESAVDFCPADASGNPFPDIGLDVGYLADTLDRIGDRCTLMCDGADKPVLITGDDDTQHIIMPIRR